MAKTAITFHVVSLFPEALYSYINESIIKRAQKSGLIKIKFYNPRDFVVLNKKSSYQDKRVDDRPYGGGPGMVLEALPVIKAIEKAVGKKLIKSKDKKYIKIIFFSPSGELFDNRKAQKISKRYTDIVLVCGRYEGIDARIKKVFKMEDISIGQFILSGGEIPALIVIDSVSRQVPGVLGDISSIEENRISSSNVYTRPEVFEYKGQKYRVPKILLSGNRKKIDNWRLNS